MNTRKVILSSTAIAGFVLLGLAEAGAETSLFEKIRTALMPSTTVEKQMVAENDMPLGDMVPPAIEPASGGEMVTMEETTQSIWANVPGAMIPDETGTPVTTTTAQGSIEGQTFIPVEEVATESRSGFDNPFDPADLNAIESAAGDATSTIDSSMGFEDPAMYSDVQGETINDTIMDSGADLINIMPAAGDAEDHADDHDDMDMDHDHDHDVVEDAVDTMDEASDMTDDAADMIEEKAEDAMDASSDMATEAVDTVKDGAAELPAELMEGVEQ